MGFFESMIAMMGTWQFWTLWLVVALLFYTAIRPLVKRIPIIGNKSMLILAGIIGIIVTSPILGTFGTASMNRPARVRIADLQVTTDFSGNCTNTMNSNDDDLLDVRCTDAQANESTAWYEVDTGIITVFRDGDLSPASCKVKVTTDEGYSSERTPGDGTAYTVVEENTLGELEVYLEAKKSGSGAAASSSSPKEQTVLEFDEGISQAHLGVVLDTDEGGHDALNQYSYKDVVINICGKPFTMRVHRMDN